MQTLLKQPRVLLGTQVSFNITHLASDFTTSRVTIRISILSIGGGDPVNRKWRRRVRHTTSHHLVGVSGSASDTPVLDPAPNRRLCE
jgi:hypothetical protein